MSLATSPAGYVTNDHDAPWPFSLDLEPEQCWCLAFSAELPCDCAGRPLAAEVLSGERVA